MIVNYGWKFSSAIKFGISLQRIGLQLNIALLSVLIPASTSNTNSSSAHNVSVAINDDTF